MQDIELHEAAVNDLNRLEAGLIKRTVRGIDWLERSGGGGLRRRTVRGIEWPERSGGSGNKPVGQDDGPLHTYRMKPEGEEAVEALYILGEPSLIIVAFRSVSVEVKTYFNFMYSGRQRELTTGKAGDRLITWKDAREKIISAPAVLDEYLKDMPAVVMMKLSNELICWRSGAGLSMASIARLLCVKTAVIKNLEQSGKNASVDLITRYAQVCEIKQPDLILRDLARQMP